MMKMGLKGLLVISVVIPTIIACAITPTPPPTAASPSEGALTIEIPPTPTQSPVSTPIPQTVQLPDGTTYQQYGAPPLMTIDPDKTYTATMRTNQGNITIELFAAEAPVTVNNFVFLAREGFYNGLTFHRVIKGFMIQAGDPKGDGTGGPGYRFVDEPVTRKYTKGIVAMANSGPNTNGSQFFIVQGTNVDLPPNYTIFGQVTQGIETVDAIAETPVKPGPFGELSSPTEPVFIEGIEITETD
jgi:cyclophilin family peptidyl-prolyl cis-trans isomerase